MFLQKIAGSNYELLSSDGYTVYCSCHFFYEGKIFLYGVAHHYYVCACFTVEVRFLRVGNSATHYQGYFYTASYLADHTF